MSRIDSEEYQQFISDWQESSQEMKNVFLELAELLQGLEGIIFSFKGRKGVSYSLRPKHQNQKDRELFAMIDVIDDDPEERWLSVCFYGDLVTDPDEMGDLVPEGLLGDDGYCFDLYEADEEEVNYLKERLKEAWENASK